MTETPVTPGELTGQLAAEYFAVMAEWKPGTPITALPVPWPSACVRVLRKHTHTDPDTGVTKADYITRELHEEGIA